MQLSLCRRSLLTGASALAGASAARSLTLNQRGALLASAQASVIDVIAGQSNELYGLTFSPTVDMGAPSFFQMFSGAEGPANSISVGGADDPLDNPDTSGQTPTPAIGNAVHFYHDYYSPTYHPSRVLFVPCAFGGTQLLTSGSGAWGVTTATGATVGSLTTNMLSRVALARVALPTAQLIFRYELIEGDFAGYGSALQLTVLDHWRGAVHSWLIYIRSKLTALGYPNFPILVGRPTAWALLTGGTAGGTTYYAPNIVLADAILRALPQRFPHVAIADSMNPTQATYQASSPIHFDAAGQRTMAGRYWLAYQTAIANTAYPSSPTWDQIDYLQSTSGYSAGFAISNAGLTLSGDANSAWKTALATKPNITGKVYLEIQVISVSGSTNMMVGLANQSADLYYYLGGSTTNSVMADYSSAGFWSGENSLLSNGASGTWNARATLACPTFSPGGIVMLAIDRALGKAWVGYNGVWSNSGNPAAGTNEWINSIPATDMVFLAASIYTSASNSLQINAKASQLTYSPPTGFSAWGM
jgi:hypothetical protein